MSTKRKYLQIHPDDNLVVALTDLANGELIELSNSSFYLTDHIKAKHKFSTCDIPVGSEAIMYGDVVGKAIQYIRRGSHINTFNLKHAASHFSGKQKDSNWNRPDISKWKEKSFLGYHRSDGQVGTQNYWLFIPLVFCENRNINVLKELFESAFGYYQPSSYSQNLDSMLSLYKQTRSLNAIENFKFEKEVTSVTSKVFENIDGIKFITHDAGCGESNQDSDDLARILAAYCVNANVGGITILSLGCQKTQFDRITKYIYEQQPSFNKPLLHFEQQQDEGSGEFGFLSEVIKKTVIGLIEANKNTRSPAPLSKLKVGVKCGGSDGFSGISANPAVGHTADLLAALDAQIFLAEFPELCGVEQHLQDRCVSAKLADQFGSLMTQYAAMAESRGAGFDMNPSAGNIKDGLITDAMKSAGAARKGGTSPITDVLDYGHVGRTPGLNLVCTPGNDVLATSGMAAAGATIQLFTTGLGTPTGNPISPVVKISTNKVLARKLPEIIDLDCGPIIDGDETITEAGEKILDYIIELASGKITTKAMQLGQDDFMFWRKGISL